MQLEETLFTVCEEEEVVELCINVSMYKDNSCPIEFDAGFTLSTRRDSASKVNLHVHTVSSQLSHISLFLQPQFLVWIF